MSVEMREGEVMLGEKHSNSGDKRRRGEVEEREVTEQREVKQLADEAQSQYCCGEGLK